MKYLAAIQHEDGIGWGVVFPDLPGCVSMGDTLDEAILNAEEALTLHLEGMIEDKEDFPAASSADLIQKDHPQAVLAMISANVKEVYDRVNVTFPRSLLRRIDREASQQGLTRAAFLAKGAEALLHAHQ